MILDLLQSVALAMMFGSVALFVCLVIYLRDADERDA